MLDTNQYKLIEEELSKESASEFVKTVLSKYANTVENTSELLNYIPKLADNQLQIRQQRLIQYSSAMDMMIVDRHMHPPKYSKDDERIKFCVLFYTCKAHFPSADIDRCSTADKEFFNEFVSMLNERKEFDYKSEDDWDWIFSIAGGADWLESVIIQHVDRGFVRPKDKVFRAHQVI